VVARFEPENHVREIIEGYRAASTTIPLIVVGNQLLQTDYARNLLTLADTRVRFIGGFTTRRNSRPCAIMHSPTVTAIRWGGPIPHCSKLLAAAT
jgi:hypothetical protein